MLCTIGAVGFDWSNDQERAEEDVMYDMNRIMHRLISSVKYICSSTFSHHGRRLRSWSTSFRGRSTGRHCSAHI